MFKRNAGLYTGKTNELKKGVRVCYLTPRKVSKKPSKITDSWLGPFKVLDRTNEVLVEITSADHCGPNMVAHMYRVTLCSEEPTANQRLPKRIELNEQEELATKIGPPVERTPTPNLGIPVQYSGPVPEIVDML